MDPHGGPSWCRKCPCGKYFYQPNSFSNHIKTCQRYKNDVGSALTSAKAKYANRKKSKKGKEAIESWYGEGIEGLDVDQGPAAIEDPVPPPQPIVAPEDIPIAPAPMGRGFRARAPPQAYKDYLATSAIPFDIPMFGQVIDSPPTSPGPALGTVCEPLSPLSERRQAILQPSQWRNTRQNQFNMSKSYWTLEKRPHDPDLFVSSSDPWEEEDAASEDIQEIPMIQKPDANPFYPFPNWSSFKLGEWYWSEGEGKSRQSFQQLVDIIGDEDFLAADIRKTKWKKMDSALAWSEFDDDTPAVDAPWEGGGMSWKTTTVTVNIPFNSASKTPGAKPFVLNDFRYRPLVPLIRAKLEDSRASEHFHVVPSELWWNPPGGGGKIRVHGELYHSDAFLDAYREVQLLPPENAQDDLPRYVVALMFASDETHLTSFGDAQIWPVYMHFGNESKDRRSKTSLKLFEEVAFFQKLPDSFSDWYLQLSGKHTVADELLRHAKREAFQAQWGSILDDEFVNAYAHGIVVDCADGVRRRFYPRILTYSADYPERMRVVGVRAAGDFPCARCLVSAPDISQLGTAGDRDRRISLRRVDDDAKKEKVEEARNLIYGTRNYAVDADKVESILKPTSLVPAENAFSKLLGPLGLDVYAISAVDVLHEVEIGVWKGLFVHLIRLLEAIPGTGQTEVLNSRFRQVPTFGRDTIRRFRHNVSAMKQFGARDYEDLLQCSLPVFEGLFPGDHDGRVQDLLFTMGHWHSLAKLRMHTDLSLDILDSWTSVLGETARAFVALTCSQFQTHELKSEYEARKRKEARGSTKAAPKIPGIQKDPARDGPIVGPPSPHAMPSSLESARGGQSQRDAHLESVVPPPPTPGESAATRLESIHSQKRDGRKTRTWSLLTPKYHSLGDVVHYIRRTGTTDSYSTQLSERYHRFPKSRYRRTNKKNVTKQLSRIQTRQARIKRLRNQLYPTPDEADAKPRGSAPTYSIGKSQNLPVNLSHFIQRNAHDHATQNFLPKLKLHLYPRIVETLMQEVEAEPGRYPAACLPVLQAAASSEPTEQDLDSIYFHSDTIYRHQILQVPYTTYDCRQEIDTINPNTSRRDFMCLLAPEDSEETAQASTSYTYGRVLGIFHANVMYGGPGALDYRRRQFDFLWVRWYTPLPSEGNDPWTSKRLDRVKLAPIFESGSWDFVDPAHILRGAHIIPRFSLGLLYDEKHQATRVFSKAAQEQLDWSEYYVNRFVDRDMTMRFHSGLAVGHLPYAVDSSTLSGGAADPGSPMEVDPSCDTLIPDHLVNEGAVTDDEDSASSLGDESSDSRLCDPEPDSEEEPDIYE